MTLFPSNSAGRNQHYLHAILRRLAIWEGVPANICAGTWLRVRFLNVKIADFRLKPNHFLCVVSHV
jgi:hypothetical protein